jgi:hypothetical protein
MSKTVDVIVNKQLYEEVLRGIWSYIVLGTKNITADDNICLREIDFDGEPTGRFISKKLKTVLTSDNCPALKPGNSIVSW